MSKKWGLCKDCKWWQIEPGASVGNLTQGECIDERVAVISTTRIWGQRLQSIYRGLGSARQGLERSAADGRCPTLRLTKMSENSVEQVRERAYSIWEREGQPEGRDLVHWLQAEQELAQESAGYDSQINAIEITEEREHLLALEDAANPELASTEAQSSRRKKAASVRP